MKVHAVLLLAGLTAASSAQVILSPGQFTASAVSLDQLHQAPAIGTPAEAVPATHYSDMLPGPTGYVAFPAANYLGYDDYDSALAGGNINVSSIRFIGGVANTGDTLFFNFYDTNSSFVTGFGASLPQGGIFVWTITINLFPGAVVIPEAGYMEILGDTGVTGQWYLGDAGATVGTSNVNDGFAAGSGYNFNFEINGIPAPGSVALAAIGGLVATRRRR